MSYEFDVFLSYRRAQAWPRFVENIFVPMFSHWLGAQLGRDPLIFVDVDCIETGMPWPSRLAASVASSRLMVCLWSREYFSSDWCQAELSHMMARRVAINADDPLPLIVAVVIHDGDTFPPELGDIQQFPIQKYSNPWMRKGSAKAEELSEKINTLSAHVAHALEYAPEHDPTWRNIATKTFLGTFRDRTTQSRPPSLGGQIR